MIEIPVCKSSNSAYPRGVVTLGVLGGIIKGDYLADRTMAGQKRRLPIACLGGTFRQLPAGVSHGNCNGRCGRLGYRNTEHIDWDNRTGIVLIDVDELAEEDIPQVRQRFAGLPCTVALWLSASRHGFKVGIAVDPLPLTPEENRDAWGTAAMLSAILLSGIHHRIDVTAAACQAAILAHDPDALVRDTITARLPWTAGDYRRANPSAPVEYDNPLGMDTIRVKDCGTVMEVAHALPWNQGQRTMSLYRFGYEVGQRGWDENLDIAHAVADRCGLLTEDGTGCLQHYQRGYQKGRGTILTIFGTQNSGG